MANHKLDAEARLALFDRLIRIGIALSAERNRERLLERILLEAKEICRADGGTLYLREEDHLKFAIMHCDSLNIALGGTTNAPIPFAPIPLYRADDGKPNHANVASHSALIKRSVNIADAYHADGFDFSGARKFDEQNRYRSRSFLTIPMVSHEGHVTGVLQLINAKDLDGSVVPFSDDLQQIVEALASQAAVALENQMLLMAQKQLMESFIKLIAEAIDDKSPYTGGHCRRVPILTEMLAKAVCDCREGPLSDFNLTEDEWYELHIAAWLHDCGKVTTPVHVMDKATKLEALYDRIQAIQTRFELLKRDAELRYRAAIEQHAANEADLRRQFEHEIATIDEDFCFLETINIGGEFMSKEKCERVHAIARRTWRAADGTLKPVLFPDEVENLLIARGTLTEVERLTINGHIVRTILMLESLPFPTHLKRVPEYAGCHHERMDGAGYPRGIYAGDASIPARIMAIADVFEALTAQDRPYKSGKTLSEAMQIMGTMKRENHLDPQLFDVFVKSGTYRRYAECYLPPNLIDEVDEAALLAITPKQFDLPPVEVRDARRRAFLPQYQKLTRQV